VFDHAKGDKPNIYNLAPEGYTSVKKLAEWCVAASPYKTARIEYSGGTQGWPGDVPLSLLNSEKLNKLGYRLTHTSDDAAKLAIAEVSREVFGATA
jgi:UDP-glucose 4-epimerase